MLGLRQFACDRCGTVHASPEVPSRCAACDCTRLAELAGTSGAAAYFAPVE
jgi:predicted Zn-ribbon and HTH transcriptional regulator